MIVVTENEHTQKTLKAGLETLYVAAGYLNADLGNMELTMHLIGAAIAEMESLTEQESRPQIHMVHGAGKRDAAK